MPIDPNTLASLSNATVPSEFENLPSIPGAGYPLGGADPNAAIQYAIDRKNFGSDKQFMFPTDLPKYHFTIVEADYDRLLPIDSSLNIPLRTEKRYKLPLPYPIQDAFEVQYDQDFSYLSQVTGASKTLQGFLNSAGGQAVQNVAQTAGAALGVTLNQMKTVTMSSPRYRQFQLSWKLAPKTFEEARTIQRICFNLRKGMSPATFGLGKALLAFPKIYIMYFSPNVKYLFKYKPCVLQSMVVDYQGGNPTPAFYRAQGGVISESPPESVMISTNWLELEYWLNDRNGPGDYKSGGDGLPTNDPLDAWNLYSIESGLSNQVGPPGSLAGGYSTTYSPGLDNTPGTP